MRASTIAKSVLFAQAATALTADQWRSQSIYQVLTDRFAPTDLSSAGSCSNINNYCGGTFRGIINHLDYIQNMGFTAIWISPIVTNIQYPNNVDGDSYHGYWAKDIYSINSQFGTAQDLKDLSSALHDRQMYLMVDVAPNHMAWPGDAASVDYSTLNPFNDQSYFHPFCTIDYSNDSSVKNCWLGNDIVELPDVRTEDQNVQDMYTSWIKQLIGDYQIDGIRFDTAKHVNSDFLKAFQSASGVYIVGEVDDNGPEAVCPYQQYLDGTLNYPAYNYITQAFRTVSDSGAISALANGINTIKGKCADTNLLGSFLENHDQPRFPSLTGDSALIRNALSFAMLADGIPILYQGQELLYSGNGVPNNREAIWPSGFPQNSPTYQLVAKLNKVRRVARAADPAGGFDHYKAYPFYTDGDTIATRKGATGAQLIGVFTNRGSSGGAEDKVLPASQTGFSGGQQVVDVVACRTLTAANSGDLTVTLHGGELAVLLPRAAVAGSQLCPGI